MASFMAESMGFRNWTPQACCNWVMKLLRQSVGVNPEDFARLL